MELSTFKNLFKYDPRMVGYVGFEREDFILGESGKIVPMAYEILSGIDNRGIFEVGQTGEIWTCPSIPSRWHPVKPGTFAYELSASQIESRIGPCALKDLRWKLEEVESLLILLLKYKRCKPLRVEVGPANMPLDVYPDPTGRYQKITKNMPREILLAACRVIGTHVHIGMPDHDTALRVYNHVIRYLAELCEAGNGSFGERLAIYKQMAPNYEPKPYASWDEYYQTALAQGFAEDPRKCWTLIRISMHGTIEFRMFGATDSIERIVKWATRCHELCLEAMTQS